MADGEQSIISIGVESIKISRNGLPAPGQKLSIIEAERLPGTWCDTPSMRKRRRFTRVATRKRPPLLPGSEGRHPG